MSTITNNTILFGVHYMLDGYGANPEVLRDKQLLLNLLNNLPQKMGMHIISDPVVLEVGEKNRKDPGGVSGFVMIAESHLSFHTFPKRGFVTIDVYTCQNELDTTKLKTELVDIFQISETEEFLQERGTKYPAHDIA